MSSPNFSVRWVYQQVRVKKHGNLMMDAGQKPCLCFRGRKHALCIAAGYPVRILKRPVEQFDKYRLVMQTPALADGKPVPIGEPIPGQVEYGVEQAVSVMQGLAKKNGITVGAQKLLDRAALQQNGINEDDYEDEEETMSENPAPVGDDGADVSTTNDAPAKPAEESTVSKKTSKKSGGKKAKATKAAKAKGAARKPAAKGPTPFRAGSAKEGAFIAFKGYASQYDKLAKGDKGEWIDKQAKKLGVTPGTLRSWIGGQFAKALK